VCKKSLLGQHAAVKKQVLQYSQKDCTFKQVYEQFTLIKIKIQF